MNPAIQISNLQKTYSNGFVALRGIDLAVQQGDFFALLGPNGAGKSTMIGIITSLVNKTAGKVWIFGHDIDSEFSIAKSFIGVVPQELNFNMWEPIEEILVNQAGYYGIVREDAYQRAEVRLKQLGLWGKRREIARSLSGGMKRRLMIARSLMHNPRLLILDEPTAGVDIEMRHSMWEFLQEINHSGTTIVLTTHYLEEAERLCRNIAIIDHGELIEETSMKSLLTRLNTETFILDLKSPLDAKPDVDCHKVMMLDGQTMEVEVDKGIGINHLFTELADKGIEVISMRNKTNRLEQLFLDLLNNREAP
jgi:ABC-2 type transport system ATP-binding protein